MFTWEPPRPRGADRKLTCTHPSQAPGVPRLQQRTWRRGSNLDAFSLMTQLGSQSKQSWYFISLLRGKMCIQYKVGYKNKTGKTLSLKGYYYVLRLGADWNNRRYGRGTRDRQPSSTPCAQISSHPGSASWHRPPPPPPPRRVPMLHTG